jgi:hypothetical protein
VRGRAVGWKTLPHLCHPLLQSKALGSASKTPSSPTVGPCLFQADSNHCWLLTCSTTRSPARPEKQQLSYVCTADASKALRRAEGGLLRPASFGKPKTVHRPKSSPETPTNMQVTQRNRSPHGWYGTYHHTNRRLSKCP